MDATYLSPHVNMAARMEAATRQFGVSILITRSFYTLLSEDAQKMCRKIDVVTVKGSVSGFLCCLLVNLDDINFTHRFPYRTFPCQYIHTILSKTKSSLSSELPNIVVSACRKFSRNRLRIMTPRRGCQTLILSS